LDNDVALTPRRHRFGGSSADVTQSIGTGNVAVFEPDVVLWAYDLGSGGSRVTDLQDEGLDGVSEVTSDASGQVPIFYGPEGVTEVWVVAAAAPSGTRALLAASDLMQDIDTLDAAIEGLVVEAGVVSLNGASGVIIDFAPDDLVPAGATDADVTELQDRIYTTTVVQVGTGYPARPTYADYVHWVGELDPAASAVDGDEWHYPDTA